MTCCQCQGIETMFDQKTALKELKKYQKKGPVKTTQVLINSLKDQGIEGKTLLDIGGGIGAIQHELLKSGVNNVFNVDASLSYIEAAKGESERLGFSGQVTYMHGNFIELASDLPPADIVTLDRVICCFDDMEALVSLSSKQAKEFYALIYPQDFWWVKMGFAFTNNCLIPFIDKHFRIFIHSTEKVDALIKNNGFELFFHHEAVLWQIFIYTRSLTT